MTQATTGGSASGPATESVTGSVTGPAAAVAMAARGKVIAAKDGVVHFAPIGTNYELHLASPNYAGTVGQLVAGVVRVTARKIWTVPSGGNFISPIFGQPRTIQGRVRAVGQGSIVVQAGVPIVIELPAEEQGYDLANGPIAQGVMVNVMALPGARIELVTK